MGNPVMVPGPILDSPLYLLGYTQIPLHIEGALGLPEGLAWLLGSLLSSQEA